MFLFGHVVNNCWETYNEHLSTLAEEIRILGKAEEQGK